MLMPPVAALLSPDNTSVPAATVVRPVKLLLPDNVSAPEPLLAKASVPVAPSRNTPAKLLALVLFTVSVAAVALLFSMKTEPGEASVFSAAMVMLLPLSCTMPVLLAPKVSVPPAPPNALVLSARKVPALTTVPPL